MIWSKLKLSDFLKWLQRRTGSGSSRLLFFSFEGKSLIRYAGSLPKIVHFLSIACIVLKNQEKFKALRKDSENQEVLGKVRENHGKSGRIK